MLELRLTNCNLIAVDCIKIALNSKLSQLRALDLSCNPIKMTGFLNLVGAESSVLRNLIRLELFDC